MNNFMKLTSNIGDWMGSSYFPYMLIGVGEIFIAYELKVI